MYGWRESESASEREREREREGGRENHFLSPFSPSASLPFLHISNSHCFSQILIHEAKYAATSKTCTHLKTLNRALISTLARVLTRLSLARTHAGSVACTNSLTHARFVLHRKHALSHAFTHCRTFARSPERTPDARPIVRAQNRSLAHCYAFHIYVTTLSSFPAPFSFPVSPSPHLGSGGDDVVETVGQGAERRHGLWHSRTQLRFLVRGAFLRGQCARACLRAWIGMCTCRQLFSCSLAHSVCLLR